MPIPIEDERDVGLKWGHPYERCCFCRTPTPFWTAMKRRKPGAQVACCPDCAKTNFQKDVPTKKYWCDKETRLEPARRSRNWSYS